MIDVKKFIVGFLILAAAAGGSGAILSYVNFSPTPSQISPDQQISITEASSSSYNSFFPVENTIGNLAINVPATSTDDTNLTNAFADAFLTGVQSANPSGLADDNGNQVLVHPDANALISTVTASKAITQAQAPNWNVEANAQPLKIVQDNSPSALAAYSQSLSQILNQHLKNNTVTQIVTSDPATLTLDDLSKVDLQSRQALSDLLNTPTPQSLVPLQRALVTVTVYDKNFLGLTQNTGSDPLKTALILQNEEVGYQTALQNLQKQSQKAVSLYKEAFPKQEIGIGFVDKIFGIQTAKATGIPVFDLGDVTVNWSQVVNQIRIMAWNTLLQIVKNTLISLIQSKVLRWVQGSGAPRFVQDLATEVIATGQQVALNYLNSKMACGVYGGSLPYIQTTLGAYFQSKDYKCADQFAAALGGYSLQQFMEHFENGGFVAFGASYLPSGNTAANLFYQANTLGYNTKFAASIAISENTANQGLKGSSACGDGSDPNKGIHTLCKNKDGLNYTIDNGDKPDTKCDPSDTPVVMPNAGLCSNGSRPQGTTPAIFTGYASQSALDSGSKLAAAANDIAGVLNAVVGSLLSSLSNAAISAANNTVNQGLTGGGILSIDPGTIDRSGTSSSTAQTQFPLSCGPSDQTVAPQTQVIVYATGGSISSSSAIPNYYWMNSANNATSTGSSYSTSFTATGTYQIYLYDSVGDATSTCTVQITSS